MSSVEHQATVDRGLKMKIKRKNVGVSKDVGKHEVIKNETKQGETSQSANGMLADKASKLSIVGDKDKSPKSKSGIYGKKEKSVKPANKPGECFTNGSGANSSLNGLENIFAQNMEPKAGEIPNTKKESMPDPYEFNAKVEDGLSSMPMKKIKLEKQDSNSSALPQPQVTVQTAEASTETTDVGVVTEPDCLGPCEPGTSVTLGGIVWHESENGVLVVNVTWRGKTYVGTLLDATRHDWAPPRLNCESPVSEFETRTPKGRGKRRAASNTPVNDNRNEGRKLRKGRRGSNVNTFQAPPSPAKSDVSTSSGVKRKGRPQDIDLTAPEGRSNKRSRSGSQAPTPSSDCPSPTLIECPEPNCNKKYKHINGLRYHQSHAHQGGNNSTTTPDDSKDVDTDDGPNVPPTKSSKKEKESVNKKETSGASKKDSGKENSKDCAQTEKSKGSDSVPNPSKKDEVKSDSQGKDSKELSKDIKSEPNKSETSSKKKEMLASAATNSKSSPPPTTSSVMSSVSSSKACVSQTLPKTVPTSVLQINSLPTSLSSSGVSSSVQSSSLLISSSAPVSSVNKVPLTSSIPVTVSSINSVSVQGKDTDVKLKPSLEARVAKTTRPIVPAPSPMLASVQVTHTNLTPVMTHTQMSPQLKPIQPKPTILGEPQNINPALAEFKDNRKKAQRKKSKEGTVSGSSARPEQHKPVERTGVIKANPQPNKPLDQMIRKDNLSKDGVRSASDATRPSTLGSSQQNKGVDLSQASRIGQGQSLLKVSSPLQVTTPENRKTPVTDDVQSPAYSDISDANESASPAANTGDSPVKQKDESTIKKEKSSDSNPSTPSEASSMASHYGMYSYYGQSPYHMNNLSPSQVSQGSSQQQKPGQSQLPNTATPGSKDLKGNSVGGEEKKRSAEEANKAEKKNMDDKGGSGKPKPDGAGNGPQSGMTPQQMHDLQLQQQQKWYQQMYMSQYPFMNNGWYPMDSAYMQQYEKMVEEHRRIQMEQGKGDPRDIQGGEGSSSRPGAEHGKGQGSGHGPWDAGRPQEVKGGPGPQMPTKRDEGPMSVHPKLSPSSLPQGVGSSDKGEPKGKSGDNVKHNDKDLKEQALREKQNENHQILKENIDLKAEMDKTRHEQSYERYRKAEELRRIQMFHEQKMIEERKMEMVRKGDARPENLSSKAPGTKPIVEHSANSRPRIPGHHASDDMRDHVKKEVSDSKSKDSLSRESGHSRDGESKMLDSKSEDKSKTPVSDKHRAPETPKHRLSGSGSKLSSPSTPVMSSSTASSVPNSPSYSPYVNSGYPYIQSQQFGGHMNVDPSHPFYKNHSVSPAMMPGYPSGSYIHPSQIAGFRGSAEEEKEKTKGLPTASDLDPKKGSDSSTRGSQYYGNVHKIHELSEKARPRSRGASPVPKKSTDTVSSIPTSVYEKHREYSSSPPTQRHVHTHHHTHVVGLQPPPVPPFAPVYDPYSAMFTGQAQSPSSLPHPFSSK